MATLTRMTMYLCQECEATSADVSDERLYTCENGCGHTFTQANSHNGRNQCPECYKMAAKVADQCCAECEAGQVEIIEGVECPFCGEGIAHENLSEHLAEEHAEDLANAYIADATYVDG